MAEGQFGFYRWHTLIRTAVLLDHETERLLSVDRHIGLDCGIDSKQRPTQRTDDGNNPNNPEISDEMLDKLRSIWLPLSFQDLDTDFDNNFS